MAKQVLRRRGTTEQHATFIGGVGEITVDTTKYTLVVHDGITAGGHPVNASLKLTTAARDAILTWEEGDEIYNLDVHRPQFYDGIIWQTL
ncbi:MAG: hypothetical protein A2293_09360 [Elusimicrobia bacterium RIFOXYB2_FULL_49_7]|nr:MAG: hypothetical protein A2293_09360 [Elusimicrobia bacterium RIFOXYB2_FULL_49_7]